MDIRNPRPNPYVGPRAFVTGEKLYGREREARELLLFLISQRIVLLHSPSGAGKTSLVQAGLIPRLREEGFHVLPVARVNLEPPASQTMQRGSGFNRYIYSAQLSLEESLPSENQIPLEQLPEMSLADYLDVRYRPQAYPDEEDRPQVEVLIFDQFEEILTLDPTDQAGRAAFFAQVGEALRPRHRWALFSMREDYIAALEPYLRSIPTRLSSHYRIDLLGVEAALQAIQNPPHAQSVEFEAEAAGKLVDDLRRVQVQQPDGSVIEQPGPYVEPVQLQVVCYRLWQNLGADDNLISVEDIAQIGDVNQSLRGYYAERVAAIAEETNASQRKLREWFERRLITETGIRSQVLMGQEQSEGLDNAVIRQLENAHLLRAEKRRGITWFELAHDRLIQPVRQDNAEWFQANLSLLQRQAEIWQKEDRPDGMLLHDQALQDAEAWAEAHANELSDADRDFLEEGRKARLRAEREREEQEQKLELAQKLADAERTRAEEQGRSARRLRRILVVTLITLGAAVILGILALRLNNQAQRAVTESLQQQATAQAARAEVDIAQAETEKQREIADLNRTQALVGLANQFALNSFEALRLFPQRSLLAAIEGIFVTKNEGEKDSPVANQALINALANSGGKVLTGHTDGLLINIISPDGHWLATAGRDGDVRLWDLTAVDPAADPLLLKGHTGPIDAMAFSPDSFWLASGSRDNMVILWELTSDDPSQAFTPLGEQGGDIASIAFTPDGRRLITGSTDGTARIWVMEAGGPTADPTILEEDQEDVFAVAVSPDGRWLATGSADGATRVWDLSSTDPATEPLILNCHDPSSPQEQDADPSILTAAFSRDGRWLASGSADAMVCLWDLSTPDPATSLWVMPGHLNEIRSVSFSPDGRWLASGSLDRTARLWNLEQEDPSINSLVMRGHEGGIITLAFSPNNHWLATGSTDFTTRAWDLTQPDPADRPLILYGHEATVRSIAISADGQWLATASMDNTARLWDLATESVAALPIRLPGPASNTLALDYSPDGRWLATGSADGSAILWDLSSREPISSTLISQGRAIRAVEFSPDGRWLTAGGFDGVANLWEISASEAITNPTPLSLDDRIMTLAFSPDGNRLAAGGTNAIIRIWDISTSSGTESHIDLTDHSNDITVIQFSPNGRWLAAGFVDGNVYLWDIESPDPPYRSMPLVSHTRQVNALSFSPDNRWLASGGGGGSVHLYDLTQAEPASDYVQLLGVENTNQNALALDFSPDSRWLATGVNLGTDESPGYAVNLFDMQSSDPASEPINLLGHLRRIRSVDFSPDGNWLATGGDEGTIFLWDMTSDNPAGNPRRLPGRNQILEVTFSPDSINVATANQDGVVRLWLPATQDLIDLACQTSGRNMTLAEWQQVLPDQPYHQTCPQWPEGN
jgi:WD40 repeat protein